MSWGRGYEGVAVRTMFVLTWCLALAACNSDDGADGSGGTAATEGSGGTVGSDGSGGQPAIEEQTVPLDVATLTLDALCFELDALPEQLSVSPEGHLWLRQGDQTWRVIDPLGGDDMQVLPPGVEVLQARSHDRALVIDTGQLWDVQGEWPQPLAWPAGLAAPSRMCGDPSRDGNGFVIAEGLLHRDVGQWWEWTDPADTPFGDVIWMARSAGACIGGEGELWLAEGTGEVWRITGDLATRMESLDGAEQAVLVDGLGAAALVEGDVLVGDIDGLTDYHFEAGTAARLSSGGEALWVVAGDTLYRLRGGEFMAAEVEGDEVQAESLWAEAGGGVWTVTSEQACHLRPAPPVRIEGVHNLQRLVSETVQIAVELSAGASLDGASLDGEALPMEPDGLDRFLAEPQTIAEGWHTLEVLASGSEGDSVRRLRFEQRRVGDLTFVGDVEPLFTEHCSGAACHGPDLDDATRPDLSTWEAWTQREDSILDRVVTKGDMPPSATRKDTWGLELQLLVSEWFETGAEQGDG